MSNLQNIQDVSLPKVRSSDSVMPAWKLLLKRELTDLWIGGKAFNLLLLYSVMLGIMAYTYSVSPELTIAPPQEAVYELLKNSIAFSIFVGLIIGSDSISGERDRSTLESLLLTPVNRRHITFAKLLAGLSPWPAAYLIAIPFLYLFAQGNAVFGAAMLWGAVTGTVLVLGYTGLGMLVSFWASSNKISYFISLSIYALLLVPAELTGDGVDISGELLQWINPVAAVNYFLSKHLISYGSVAEYWPWLISSVLLAILTVGLLLRFASSRLRLEPGLRRKIRGVLRKVIGLFSTLVLMVILLSVPPVHAFQASQTQEKDIAISIDSKFKQVRMGDVVGFSTIVTNNGEQASAPLIAALNVINLDAAGEAVDVEEWSPERTQHIDALGPGGSVDLDWRITPGLHGEYLAYIVLIPQPASVEVTTFPVASSSLSLTVTPSARLRPEGVLPFALGVPIFMLAITFVVYRRRRQQLDMGESL